ncbi:hypothetical protein VCHC47A1_3087, partial [Vibrio cholerae HC-47A1]
MAGEGV